MKRIIDPVQLPYGNRSVSDENFINEMPIYKGYLINEVQNNIFIFTKATFFLLLFQYFTIKHNDKEDIWI